MDSLFTGTVLVVGMARSGIAVARLLAEKGISTRVNDQKTEAELGESLDALPNISIERRFGEDPKTLLQGVSCVVISPGVPIQSEFVRFAKRLGVPVIGELELAYRFNQGVVVGITGTNGKTTTTALTAEIFKSAGRVSYAVGNIGQPWSALTETIKPGDVAVVEVSSFQLESIDTFRPRVSAILNISEDHIVRHGSMDVYIRLKERIFENQRDEDTVVLNYDDTVVRGMAERAKCHVLFYSRTQRVPGGVYLSGGNIVFDLDGVERTLCPVDEVRIPGPHNLEDAMAASAIAAVLGVPYPVIRHTLRSFAGVEHRIELVRDVNGVRFINDSKGTNVDATIKAVQSMDRPTVILLGGYDKKTDFLPLCKELIGSQVHKVVVLGETKTQLLETLKAVGFSDVYSADGFEQAVRIAHLLAQPGWAVLLSPACASFDMFKDFEERGRTFKEIVRRL